MDFGFGGGGGGMGFCTARNVFVRQRKSLTLDISFYAMV